MIKDDLEGVIKFQPWPHLLECLEIFLTHKEVIILKARQIGMSWLVAGYGLWRALFYEGSRVLMLSQGQDEAAALLDKSRFIYMHLPASVSYTHLTLPTKRIV